MSFTYARIRFLILSAVMLVLPVRAQLLWSIAGEEGKAPSYLFGTIHIQTEDVFVHAGSLLERIASCDLFAGEMSLDGETKRAMSEALRLPAGVFLEQSYTAEEYAELSGRFGNLTGLDISFFHGIKPVGLLFFLMQSFYPRDIEVSLDEYLYEQARELVPVTGLETLEEQLALIEAVSAEDVLRFFSGADPEELEEKARIILELYLAGDLDGMLLLGEEKEERSPASPFSRRALVNDRNARMADRLSGLMGEGSVFCAVGAGHLGGTNGMIAILRRRGYTLEPVDWPDTEAESGEEVFGESPWIRSGPDDGSFSCLWPRIPRNEKQIVQTPFGGLEVMNWIAEAPGLSVGLSLSEYPEAVVKMLGEEALYGMALQTAAQSMKGRVVSSGSAPVAGRSGREARILFGQDRYEMNVRILLDKGRVFVLQAVSEADSSDREDIVLFLTSLEIR